MAEQRSEETETYRGSYSLVGEELVNVEQVARVLPIKGCAYLATVEFSIRNNVDDC